ncbi:hypothetical protein C6Y14_09305 [Streptomyces dioscori]|uniref:Secreted protein n=1 Tax=Streptomyces dioscori TaxID=2109333 RepID=A0A2P8QC68_9ACTN|nr:hypothetical protein [Streptomyces dioscori]PSM43798.1 hypothetical protein C6Y14_09305 [Streptomyces dioscori]
MRRGLVHVLAWSLATGVAVTLSWWGVHTVMTGTAYDPPRALPIAADAATQGAKPLSSSTSRAESPAGSAASPSKSRSPRASGSSSAAPSTSSSPSPSASRSKSAGAASPSAGASGEVKSYDTDGGRAVFDLGTASASLVSATPASGWSMQVWKTETWIRVEFSSGADRVSVFCTWHDSAPRVEVNTY